MSSTSLQHSMVCLCASDIVIVDGCYERERELYIVASAAYIFDVCCADYTGNTAQEGSLKNFEFPNLLGRDLGTLELETSMDESTVVEIFSKIFLFTPRSLFECLPRCENVKLLIFSGISDESYWSLRDIT